jgi:formylmethanofuran dehydrogenase subunit B
MGRVPTITNATCLGCGCACDDIDVVVDRNRIVEPRQACALGAAWFGDGVVPERACMRGREVTVDAALDSASGLLRAATRPLVYLAPDLSCEAQREGVAIADALHATLDSVTSATVMESMLAQQERGRAGATLGEVRNRADLLVFWAVDPADRYPRYWTRYAPEPAGVHVPDGRRSRTVVAVDVDDARGPADADLRVAISAANEVATITTLRAMTSTPAPGSDPGGESFRGQTPGCEQLASTLLAGKYVVIVADAEPDDRRSPRDDGRADALIALAQALNGSTRCALSSLRAGGNRSGADAVATWQTGYPAAIDFARGYPRYRPHEGAAGTALQRGGFDAVLVLGSAAGIPADVASRLAHAPCAVIGPRASHSPLASAHVVIDTAVAGIHEAGTAIRMDEVPVPLRPSIAGPPAASAVAAALRARISRPVGPDTAPLT